MMCRRFSGLVDIRWWRRCWLRSAHPGLRRRCRPGSPRDSIAENREFCAAIVLPERAVIGVAALGPNSADGPCSCAYFIDPQHWGLGYASEAMGAFLAYFMRKFDLCEVAADHFDDNPASGAVLRKLGFQELGKGSGKSQARLEPAPVTLYRLRLDDLKAVL